MSQKTWDKLSENHRNIILTAAGEAQTLERQMISDGEGKDLELIEQSGVQVEKNPDTQAFKEIAVGSYKVFAEKYGDELIKELSKAK